MGEYFIPMSKKMPKTKREYGSMNSFGYIANSLLKYPQKQTSYGYLTYVLLHISKTLLFKFKTNEILGIFGYFPQTICYMPNFPYSILYSFLKNKKTLAL